MQHLVDTPQGPPQPEEPIHPTNNNQESKWDQIASFSNTKIENWNNDDIIHWLTSVNNVTDQDYRLIVAEIKDSACIGQDIMTLESAQDFADAFGINNNASCKALFKSLSKFKAKSDWKLIPIEQWTNKDVLSWINTLHIDNQYKLIMTNTVTEIECTGDDIACLEAEDVGEAFQIDNQILASELFTIIQSLTSNNNNNNNIQQITEIKNNTNNFNNYPTSGNFVSTQPQFFVGQVIECSDINVNNKWYGSKIKEVQTNRVLVQFLAFMPDEWITAQQYNIRIRNPITKQPFGNEMSAQITIHAPVEYIRLPDNDNDNIEVDTDSPTPSISLSPAAPAPVSIPVPVPAPNPAPNPVQQHVQEPVEEEEKYVSEVNYSWKEKKMRNWNNIEILDWIKCMNLGIEWNNKILGVIEMNECTGEDINELKTANDLSDAFEIDNYEMCQRIATEIKNFKPDGDDDTVRINVLYRNENIILDEEFIKTDMVLKVKMRFKMQKGINIENKYIHFRYKNQELFDNNILEQYNIINENNVIQVILDNVFPVFIFAQGKNITLNEKVTSNCKISKIKEMYKTQSGVHANMEDILFYNLKQNKLLESNKTLAQCGIVDDKNLITVRFGADGGKE